MGDQSSDVVQFDLGPLLQGQTRTAKFKSANNSLIIDPRGLQCETNQPIFSLYVFYYCFYMFAMFGDTPPARNKVSSVSLVS